MVDSLDVFAVPRIENTKLKDNTELPLSSETNLSSFEVNFATKLNDYLNPYSPTRQNKGYEHPITLMDQNEDSGVYHFDQCSEKTYERSEIEGIQTSGKSESEEMNTENYNWSSQQKPSQLTQNGDMRITLTDELDKIVDDYLVQSSPVTSKYIELNDSEKKQIADAIASTLNKDRKPAHRYPKSSENSIEHLTDPHPNSDNLVSTEQKKKASKAERLERSREALSAFRHNSSYTICKEAKKPELRIKKIARDGCFEENISRSNSFGSRENLFVALINEILKKYVTKSNQSIYQAKINKIEQKMSQDVRSTLKAEMKIFLESKFGELSVIENLESLSPFINLLQGIPKARAKGNVGRKVVSEIKSEEQLFNYQKDHLLNLYFGTKLAFDDNNIKGIPRIIQSRLQIEKLVSFENIIGNEKLLQDIKGQVPSKTERGMIVLIKAHQILECENFISINAERTLKGLIQILKNNLEKSKNDVDGLPFDRLFKMTESESCVTNSLSNQISKFPENKYEPFSETDIFQLFGLESDYNTNDSQDYDTNIRSPNDISNSLLDIPFEFHENTKFPDVISNSSEFDYHNSMPLTPAQSNYNSPIQNLISNKVNDFLNKQHFPDINGFDTNNYELVSIAGTPNMDIVDYTQNYRDINSKDMTVDYESQNITGEQFSSMNFNYQAPACMTGQNENHCKSYNYDNPLSCNFNSYSIRSGNQEFDDDELTIQENLRRDTSKPLLFNFDIPNNHSSANDPMTLALDAFQNVDSFFNKINQVPERFLTDFSDQSMGHTQNGDEDMLMVAANSNLYAGQQYSNHIHNNRMQNPQLSLQSFQLAPQPDNSPCETASTLQFSFDSTCMNDTYKTSFEGAVTEGIVGPICSARKLYENSANITKSVEEELEIWDDLLSSDDWKEKGKTKSARRDPKQETRWKPMSIFAASSFDWEKKPIQGINEKLLNISSSSCFGLINLRPAGAWKRVMKPRPERDYNLHL